MSVEDVRHAVTEAAAAAGRDPTEVTLIGAVKQRTAQEIDSAIDAGLTAVGENRAEQLTEHQRDVTRRAAWHFWGEIQSAKVKLLDAVDLIHSVDRLREAEMLQRRGESIGRAYDVLIEVNVSGEAAKQGIAPDDADELVDAIAALTKVNAKGLMIVAPEAPNPEDVRWVFTEARKLRDRLADRGVHELSMGMTDDYVIAIEEGATMVRVGRAIFGDRRP